MPPLYARKHTENKLVDFAESVKSLQSTLKMEDNVKEDGVSWPPSCDRI